LPFITFPHFFFTSFTLLHSPITSFDLELLLNNNSFSLFCLEILFFENGII